MNRFLKKEWDDTEIPERSYLQARTRAWTALHTKGRLSRRNLVWTAAAAAAMAALALFWFSGQENSSVTPNPSHQQATRQSGASDTPVASNRTAAGEVQESRRAVLNTGAGLKRRIDKPSLQTPTSDGPDRLVLNFVLPESGVRMIWILDKDFQLNGEIE